MGDAGPGLLQVIGGIYDGGTTNLSGGCLKGMEALRTGQDGAGPRKVLLLTDGLANVGITEPEALVQMTGKAAAAGVGTSTIGFGGDFAEELLTQMADAGGGNAHYAPTPDQAPAIFRTDSFPTWCLTGSKDASVCSDSSCAVGELRYSA